MLHAWTIRTRLAWRRLPERSSCPSARPSRRDRDSAHAGVALAPAGDIGATRAHLSSSRRLGRYRIRSSIKLIHNATSDHWPPVFNLVQVEPNTIAHESAGTGLAFADFIIREFDIVPCQVAYFSGDDARLVAQMSDTARDARTSKVPIPAGVNFRNRNATAAASENQLHDGEGYPSASKTFAEPQVELEQQSALGPMCDVASLASLMMDLDVAALA